MNRLFSTYYHERNSVRRSELCTSIAFNAEVFDRIHILSERAPVGGNILLPKNGEWRVTQSRQTYSDLVKWANEVAEPDDLVVLSNTDIVFPPESVRLMAQNIGKNEAYCLSRWEIGQGGGLYPYHFEYTQDAWAVRGRFGQIDADWPMGIPGCENKFAHELKKTGYRLFNPCKTIKTIHLHVSGVRTATNAAKHRLPPPYEWVPPVHLDEIKPTYSNDSEPCAFSVPAYGTVDTAA